MEAAFENCLVIGDSFVKRLYNYHRNRFERGYFWVHASPVTACGKSGAVVSDVDMDVVDIRSGAFSVVAVACGSNDLCHGRMPDDVADDLVNMAQFLVRFRGVERVVICQLLRRTKANRHLHITLDDFNERVCQVNEIVKARCSGLDIIIFWKHDHRIQRNICVDGTHLNFYGVQLFHSSLYRALWSQLKIVLRMVCG